MVCKALTLLCAVLCAARSATVDQVDRSAIETIAHSGQTPRGDISHGGGGNSASGKPLTMQHSFADNYGASPSQQPCTTSGPPVISGALDDPEPGTPFWLSGERFCDQSKAGQNPQSADCSHTVFVLTELGQSTQQSLTLEVVSVTVGGGDSIHCASSAVLMFPPAASLLGSGSNVSVTVVTPAGKSNPVSVLPHSHQFSLVHCVQPVTHCVSHCMPLDSTHLAITREAVKSDHTLAKCLLWSGTRLQRAGAESAAQDISCKAHAADVNIPLSHAHPPPCAPSTNPPPQTEQC
jgi:hypothetical protein